MNLILQNTGLNLKKRHCRNSLISLAVTLPFVMPLTAVLLSSSLPAAPLDAPYLTVNDLSVLTPLDIGFLIGFFALFIPKKTKLTLAVAFFGILLNAVFFINALYWILIRTIPFGG